MRVRRTGWVALCAGLGALSAIPALGGRQETAASRAPLVVEVRFGDSLWTIAQKHGDPDRDIREVVWRISEENKVDPGNLQPGDEIAIPAECLPRGRRDDPVLPSAHHETSDPTQTYHVKSAGSRRAH